MTAILVSRAIKVGKISSHSVLGNWRFFAPDKENAKRFMGTKKCTVTKTHKGACADWVFVEAEPPEWAAEQLPFVRRRKIFL